MSVLRVPEGYPSLYQVEVEVEVGVGVGVEQVRPISQPPTSSQQVTFGQLDLAKIAMELEGVSLNYIRIGRKLSLGHPLMEQLKSNGDGNEFDLQLLRVLDVFRVQAANKSATSAIQQLTTVIATVNNRASKKFSDSYVLHPEDYLRPASQTTEAFKSANSLPSPNMDISLLCDELSTFSHRAMHIGAGLGIPINYLDTNLKHTQLSYNEKLQHVLTVWQQVCENKTLDKLADVLGNRLGGNNGLSAKTFRSFCHNNPNHFDCKAPREHPFSPHMHPAEMTTLEQQLRQTRISQPQGEYKMVSPSPETVPERATGRGRGRGRGVNAENQQQVTVGRGRGRGRGNLAQRHGAGRV